MAWRVRMPDGTLSEPFDTFAEADAHQQAIEERDERTPQEIFASESGPRVSEAVFLRRIAMGWRPHRALHTTMDGRYLGITRSHPGLHKGVDEINGRAGELHEMMGRQRTIAQWSVTSGVSESRIRKGIKRCGNIQSYFLSIGWYPSKPARPENDIPD